MPHQLKISPLKLAIKLMIGVFILTLCSIGVQIGKFVFDYREEWTRMINLDREMNIPTWYSTFMLAFCAILLGAIAREIKTQLDQESQNLTDHSQNQLSGKSLKGSRYRYYHQWKLLSLIFWFLALDEVFMIHEILIIPDLAKALHLPSFLYSIWVIPGAIAVIIFIWKYWQFLLHLPKKSRFHFMLAICLYVGGALGMEMVGGYLTVLKNQQTPIYAAGAILEEVMEMMGTIVFIYGLLVYIRDWLGTLQVEINILDK